MNKIIKNAQYQFLFQFAKIVIPLISIPIISRALGPNNLGVYNYTLSIVQYVVILSGLGINLYGNKEIAKVKDDKKELSEKFFSLVYLKIITTISILVCYFILILFTDYYIIFLIQSMLVISVLVDISWFFMGLEEFKLITILNLTIQVIALVFIILLIKTPDDLILFIFIQSFSVLLSNLCSWFFVRKHVFFCKPNFGLICKIFFSSLPYFIPQITVLLYTNLNKTMLGIFSTADNVAFYSNAQSIISMIVVLVTSLDNVMLPRISYMVEHSDRDSIINVIDKTLHFQLFLTIGSFFGLNLIIGSFVPLFFGSEYEILTKVIPMLSPLLIVIPLGIAISRQYLIPYGKINDYNLSIIIGALINLSICFFTVRKFGLMAVIFSNLIAEIFVSTVRLRKFSKEVDYHFDKKIILKYVFSGLSMYFVTKLIFLHVSFQWNILSLLSEIIVGSMVYLIITLILNVNPINNILMRRNVNK